MNQLRHPRDVFDELHPPVRAASQALTAALRDNAAMDKKTRELVYIGVMSACRLPEGVYSHTLAALRFGASAAECVDACLHAIQVAGAQVHLYSLPEVDRAIRDAADGSAS